MHETCRRYVDRRLSEGWKVVSQRGNYLILSPPDGNFPRVVDLRNDVETLRPDSAGDECGMGYQDGTYHGCGACPAHCFCVNEVTPDELETVVGSNTPGEWERDLYNLDATTGEGNINWIRVYARCKKDAGTTSKVKIVIKSGTGIGAPDTVRESGEINLSESWVNENELWALNPATGAAWTWSEVDRLQAGISMYYEGEAYNYCTQVYVEVGYTAVPTQAYKDIATRFKLTVGVQAYKDTSTRFRLRAQTYKDTATRFKLTILAYKDTATRFILTALNYQDIATRFRLIVQAYKDIATRFQLTVQAYKDTASRFRLIVQNYRDAATRFRLWVEAYRDIATRFILNALNYQDIAARFKLTVRAYQDVAARFKVIAQEYKDIITRFKLSIQTYQGVSTRFFLYQPTWEEIQIQQAVAALKAEIAGLELEPRAHFRI